MTLGTPRTVILHATDDPGDVQRALDAASGVRSLDPSLHVRIIVNGGALTGLTGAADLNPPEGTEVAACSVGLGRRGIDHDELRPGVQSVPSAVAAIVEAQLAGAAYVRL